MSESKIRAAIANCVVALVRHDMQNRSMTSEDAYRALYGSELYRLLQNPATRLYLEPNVELARYYDLEINRGPQALMEFFRAVEFCGTETSRADEPHFDRRTSDSLFARP